MPTSASITDPAAWVLDYGSARLRKAHMLGMLENSMGVYHSERTAHELPGYELMLPADARRITERRNPAERELDALAEARASHPGAQLVSLDHGGAWTPAIAIPLPWEPKRAAVKILGW